MENANLSADSDKTSEQTKEFKKNFQKEKYLEMAKTQGLQVAVNQLHHDLWEIEKECFDTPNGYQPELWSLLNEMRLFSRELWDLKLDGA